MNASTLRRTLTLFTALAAVSCGGGETRAGARRTTLPPGPALYLGFDFSKDGRIAYGKFIDGKAAIYVANGDGTNAHRVSFGVWDSGPLWSPDGKWIVFGRDAGGQGDVVIIPADSGAERIVAGTPASEGPNAWLSDGSGVVFSRGTPKGFETWVYYVADGSSAKLLDVDGSTDAYTSPDGKWITYTLTKGGHSTVWLWDVSTKKHRQLTTEGFESVAYGAFSPDSRSILYESRRTGTSDLWRVDVAAGTRTQLTQDVADDASGRWSPDGTRIVFVSNRGGQPDLWVLSNGESDIQRLTDDAIGEGTPQWTPDGRSIVANVALGQPHLYSLPIAGGPAVALTSGDWAVTGAEVSHDGSQVAYSGTKNGDQDIWIVPVSGGESKLVSGAPGYDGDPAWSPDGSRIAFTSVRAGNADIWIAPVGGGAATRLTDWPSNEGASRWSPDGKTVAFVSNHEATGFDVWTVSAGGGTATRLTTLGTVQSPLRWSTDGRSIAFAAQVGGLAVFTVPAAGGAPRQVAPATSLRPEWSPNGREISVSTCDHGYCAIDVFSVDGKVLRSLSDRKEKIYEIGHQWSSSGSQVMVGPQNLAGDGEFGIEVRPSAGGSTTRLNAPPGYFMVNVGFGAGDKVAIGLGGPNGTALQRIEVPPPAAKR